MMLVNADADVTAFFQSGGWTAWHTLDQACLKKNMRGQDGH